MYALPATPTPDAIIRRSLVCHPSMFAQLAHQAHKAHAEAAATMNHHQAQATAKRLARACADLHAWADDCECADQVTARIMGAGMDSWISALNIAARLQCLPPHLVSEAAGRGPTD